MKRVTDWIVNHMESVKGFIHRSWVMTARWIKKDLLTKQSIEIVVIAGDGLKIATAWLLELLSLAGAIWMIVLAVESVAGAEYVQALGSGLLAGWLLALCILSDRYTNGPSETRGGVEKK